MATSKIAIGNKVISNKSNKVATITGIITKSSGYIVLMGENGVSFKDIACNYTTLDGQPLKAKPTGSSQASIIKTIAEHKRNMAEAYYYEHKF